MQVRVTGIICERAGQWALALRQAFDRAKAPGAEESAAGAAEDFRLVETRSADDCLAVLGEEPLAVVVVELCPATCDQALSLVAEVARRFPLAPVIVLAAREMALYEWLARELGAVHFASSPRRLQDVVAIVRRHGRRLPVPEMGTAEAVWATLPWK